MGSDCIAVATITGVARTTIGSGSVWTATWVVSVNRMNTGAASPPDSLALCNSWVIMPRRSLARFGGMSSVLIDISSINLANSRRGGSHSDMGRRLAGDNPRGPSAGLNSALTSKSGTPFSSGNGEGDGTSFSLEMHEPESKKGTL